MRYAFLTAIVLTTVTNRASALEGVIRNADLFQYVHNWVGLPLDEAKQLVSEMECRSALDPADPPDMVSMECAFQGGFWAFKSHGGTVIAVSHSISLDRRGGSTQERDWVVAAQLLHGRASRVTETSVIWLLPEGMFAAVDVGKPGRITYLYRKVEQPSAP